MREFFGFGGYERPAEGYFSWQHLLFVSLLVGVMIVCAVVLGRRYRWRDDRQRNRVLIASAFFVDGFELFKIILLSVRHSDATHFLYELPLFLCSIQLIAIPLAAFSRGRLREASLDFVAVFGLLGAVFGTYFAGNNYGTYPVLSFDNVVSGLTHCGSGFASLYVMICGMTEMKRRNLPITIAILGGFCAAAYIANLFLDCNYMFLSRGDGTPYDILFNLVGGNPILYPLTVFGLFVIYIPMFYWIYGKIAKKAH